jgi:hypothetical protein
MPEKQKRDNAYYEERMKNDFPAIYADLQAGKHRTIAEAAIAAGLKKSRTRLHEPKNAFGKASKAEQSAFLGWLAAEATRLPQLQVLSLVVQRLLWIGDCYPPQRRGSRKSWQIADWRRARSWLR